MTPNGEERSRSHFCRLIGLSVQTTHNWAGHPKGVLLGHADNMWFGDGVFSAAYRPNPSAPSCVPCNYSRGTSELAVPRPAGCPCRPEQLCQADKDQQIFPNASQYCGIPRYFESTCLSNTDGSITQAYQGVFILTEARSTGSKHGYRGRLLWQVVRCAA